MTSKRPAARKTAPVDPAFLRIVNAFSQNACVTAGKLMSSYGLKVHGKIFAMHGRGRLVVKLPKQRVDQLVNSGLGKRFDPGHGRIMKEWVTIELQAADWLSLAKEAYDFVRLGASS